MDNTTVSVIIPTFNNGTLVPEAVQSVLAQSVPLGELIVVNDASWDDTRQRLLPFAGSIHYVYQRNQGVAAARNHGLEVAHGNHVAFLDADDVWHPRRLAIQFARLKSQPDLGLLGTDHFEWPTRSCPK
jgi:glycosyltransferase involved in cell wall biosynthesis